MSQQQSFNLTKSKSDDDLLGSVVITDNNSWGTASNNGEPRKLFNDNVPKSKPVSNSKRTIVNEEFEAPKFINGDQIVPNQLGFNNFQNFVQNLSGKNGYRVLNLSIKQGDVEVSANLGPEGYIPTTHISPATSNEFCLRQGNIGSNFTGNFGSSRQLLRQ